MPRIFAYLRRRDRSTEAEMLRVFNMGIGMVLVVPRERGDEARSLLEELDEQCFVIGEMAPGPGRVVYL